MAAHIVAVGDVDLAVRVQLRRIKERVEGEHRLVDTALGIEIGVGVGRVGPARGHVLRSGRDTVVALDLVVAGRRPVQDLEGADVEHVEGRVLVEEKLRRADEILRPRLDRQPGLRVVGVERARTAGTSEGHSRARRDWVAPARCRRARDDVRKGDACAPKRTTRRARSRRERERKRRSPERRKSPDQSLHSSSFPGEGPRSVDQREHREDDRRRAAVLSLPAAHCSPPRLPWGKPSGGTADRV
jgi:hypothetical protein